MDVRKISFLGLRFSLAFVFLWAFADKVFGLGFSTCKEAGLLCEKAWLSGGSPTAGFLTNSVRGPLAETFQNLAGLAVVDWLFMLGLLFVGLTLLVNRFVLLGGIAGSIMMLLMWLSMLPPQTNPIIDQHIVYIFALMLLATSSNKNMGFR
jgi:thiosulfate dehydrogenase (quinone) large subunit